MRCKGPSCWATIVLVLVLVVATVDVAGAGTAHLWSKRLGDTSMNWASSVASDPSGNTLVAGYSASSSIDMGGGPLPGAGNYDMVVAKYSASGTHLWSKRLGSTNQDIAYSVASDPSGNVLVAGVSSSPSIDMGGGPLFGDMGYYDMVVAKYSASGTHLWSKRLGGTGGDEARSVASDPSGNVLVAGSSRSSSIDLGGGPLIAAGGSYDMVVAKYSASGTHLWSKRLGSTSNNDWAYSVASDPSGNVLVAGGSYSSLIDMGGGPLPGVTLSFDMVVAKYSASGTHLWSKRLGGTDYDYAISVASDPSGNVLVAGNSKSSLIDLGGGPLPGREGYYDMVMAKYSASGTHLWSKRLGGTSNDEAYSVASDPFGNVLVAGYSGSSSIDLGGGPLSGAASNDMVVAEYSASGTHLWSKRLGGTGDDFASSVGSDPSGNVLVAGSSRSSSIDLGGGPLPGREGYYDMMVAKYVVDDNTPPASTFNLPPVVSNAVGIALTGTATDDNIGVESLTVTYTNSLNAQVVVAASVSCSDEARRSCTFSAQGPGSAGVWTANSRARDRAGNVESPGPTVTVVAIP